MFQPDTSNLRTRNRLKSALAFAVSRFSTNNPKPWATRDIDRYFTQQQNPVSQWLRQQLLIEHSGYYNSQTGKCKEYLLNAENAEQLRLNLGLKDKKFVVQCLKQEYHKQLQTLDFEYKDRSNRLWNPIQNIRSEFRHELLAEHGLSYRYDIEAAAPTLISQLSRFRGYTNPTPCIDLYLKDRQQVRQALSQATGIRQDQIKQIINALFCGAQISHWTGSSIYQICNENHYLVEQLKQNTWINELREEIKLMWKYIFENERVRDNTGRLQRITSKERWSVYFELERQVLDEIRSYTRKQKINCFLEHDGFTTDVAVNTMELEDRIRQTTGFIVRLSVEITTL
jgi:hypothetical protein